MSCEGCRYFGRKLRFLGWRPWCRKFKVVRDYRCIDWSK